MSATTTPASATLTYTRYELLRGVRNARFFVFSLVFPLVLYFLVAGANRHQQLDGVSFPLYYMTGMAAWGTMAAVVAGGARIAAERALGWNRQLRVTPLSTWAYLQAKVVTGYTVALASIALLYAAGVSLGVHLPADRWVLMTAMLLVGLVPFAVLGILLGHLVTPESMGPAMGGTVSLFALLGGVWSPIASGGVLRVLSECLPSYWLVQAGKLSLGGGFWPAKAWAVLIVWTVVLGRLAVRAWQRDTERA
jgi:ABC-2 type transport system permease protein